MTMFSPNPIIDRLMMVYIENIEKINAIQPMQIMVGPKNGFQTFSRMFCLAGFLKNSSSIFSESGDWMLLTYVCWIFLGMDVTAVSVDILSFANRFC